MPTDAEHQEPLSDEAQSLERDTTLLPVPEQPLPTFIYMLCFLDEASLQKKHGAKKPKNSKIHRRIAPGVCLHLET